MASESKEDEYSKSIRSSSRSQVDPDDITYDTLVTDFMFEVAEKKPSLVQEFAKIFTPKATLEEMFKFLWSLDEAKETLKPNLTFSVKTIKAAHAYWTHGNACMKNGDRDHALKFYNKSLREAPHPVIVMDGKQWGQEECDIVYSKSTISSATEEKDPYEEEGWGAYSALAHAYEARARVLFSLEQYQKCREDIDRVLAWGCSAPVEEKMIKLREECERLGPLDIVQAEPCSKNQSVSFLYQSPEPPTLTDPNPSYPSFSSAVNFVTDDEHGRHMVASRDIAAGEVVSVDKAYSAVLYPKYFGEYCTICLKRTSAPVPCPNCTTVIFCSEKCRLNGLAGCHKVECSILHTLARLNMSNNAVLAIRLFSDMGYINLKSMVPPLQEKANSTERQELDDAGVYNSGNYRTVYSLVTNKDKRGVNDLLKRTMESFVLLKLLLLTDEYFVDNFGNKLYVDDDEVLFTGTMLMHHMMVLWCNADTIGEIQHERKDSTASPVVAYGTGLFPSSSLLNHACYSTCASVSYGYVQVMRACRRISAGTEMTRQYADLFQKKLHERMAILKARYHFVCHCQACLGNWPFTLPFNYEYELKCVVCGKAVLKESKKCQNCNIVYNHQGPLLDRPEVTIYDYPVMRAKMDDALEKYMMAVPRFMEGSDTPEDYTAIKELLDLYDTFVVLPTHGHIVVQSLLHAASLRKGTSAYVKGNCWNERLLSWKTAGLALQ
ncbi:SET and MYND domain-containing protein 4-like [Portunus trituberculatus]|nr:SET and MYND domain-containing protein 4-like [Portunus trituberculatus]